MVSMGRTNKGFFLFRTIKGRHILSLWASRLFERSGIKRFFGVNLVAAVVVTGVISPETDLLLNQLALESNVNVNPIEATTTTLTTYELPLVNFRISQGFTFWHPGLDMTAPLGTPIYAIEAGLVEFADSSLLGYGRHVIINHERGIQTLYGHMSEIKTIVGTRVNRGELIGKVGSTGWSSGNHLHLEIRQNGTAINPFDVLPLKFDEVVWEGTVSAQSTQLTSHVVPDWATRPAVTTAN